MYYPTVVERLYDFVWVVECCLGLSGCVGLTGDVPSLYLGFEVVEQIVLRPQLDFDLNNGALQLYLLANARMRYTPELGWRRSVLAGTREHLHWRDRPYLRRRYQSAQSPLLF